MYPVMGSKTALFDWRKSLSLFVLVVTQVILILIFVVVIVVVLFLLLFLVVVVVWLRAFGRGGIFLAFLVVGDVLCV